MVNGKKDSDVLEDTIEVLNRDGWLKGNGYGSRELGYCLMGGISVAAYSEEWFDSHCLGEEHELHYAHVLGFSDQKELFDWNDTLADKEMVIKLLQNKIVDLRAEGK